MRPSELLRSILRGNHVHARESDQYHGGAAGRVVSGPVREPSPALVGWFSVDRPCDAAAWVLGGAVCAGATCAADAACRRDAVDGRSGRW